MELHTLPLFPLNTVLFPGGHLPLRVFEPRYLDMISDCMKHGTGFGVCLIRAGREVGQAALPHSFGTVAKVEDFEALPDGLLGITVMGQQRFRIESMDVDSSQLLLAEVEMLEDPFVPLPEQYQAFAELLDEAFLAENQSPAQVLDANWLAYRLAEQLSVSMPARQNILEAQDAETRLMLLAHQLH